MPLCLFGINGGNLQDKRRDLCLHKYSRACVHGQSRGGLGHVHAVTFAGESCGWVLTRQITAHKGTFCSCHSVFFLLPSVC